MFIRLHPVKGFISITHKPANTQSLNKQEQHIFFLSLFLHVLMTLLHTSLTHFTDNDHYYCAVCSSYREKKTFLLAEAGDTYFERIPLRNSSGCETCFDCEAQWHQWHMSTVSSSPDDRINLENGYQWVLEIPNQSNIMAWCVLWEQEVTCFSIHN